MNTFVNVPEYPPADFKGVVRSNFDTLYSDLVARHDQGAGRHLRSGHRWTLLPAADAGHVDRCLRIAGLANDGHQGRDISGDAPGWRPDLRDRFAEEFKLPKDTQRIDAPTPYVWLIGRTKTDGPPDYDAVHKIQAGYKVTLLSELGKTPKPVEFKPDPSVDMKTPPKVQVDTMAAGKYFAYAAELLKLHPPHVTDEPIIAQMKKIGIEAARASTSASSIQPCKRRWRARRRTGRS